MLDIRYKGKSIDDVLEMTAEEAVCFFECCHGKTCLRYIKLGQPSTTLTGGEAQRVKLAAELLKTSTGSILYIKDEPTIGLHTADVHKMLFDEFLLYHEETRQLHQFLHICSCLFFTSFFKTFPTLFLGSEDTNTTFGTLYGANRSLQKFTTSFSVSPEFCSLTTKA